jgi:hypothetical protein
MFGWSDHPERLAMFFRIMKELDGLHKSMIICRIHAQKAYDRTKNIDLWWGGQQRNGDLMLLLAHLLSLNPEWHGCRITIKSIARSEEEKETIERNLDAMIPEIRIRCRREVFLKPKDISIKNFIHQESKNAEVVFLGLAQPAPGDELAYAHRLKELVEGLGTTILIKNASIFVGDLIA